MPFRTLLETIADHRRNLAVYAPDDSGADLADTLATRNLTVDHRKLPSLGSEAFVVVRDGGKFYGAQNCALVARETDGRQYRGVRTYDQALVAEAFDALA